jgi:hypothetical protein
MLNLSNSSATGSPVRTIDSDVAAFLVQSMKTFVQVRVLHIVRTNHLKQSHKLQLTLF